MIYISSSAVKVKSIKEAVIILHKNNFTNIELSGGTNYYPEIEEDLLELKKEYKLNYLCHNYFPPPHEDFVVNLASLDKEIIEKSVSHLSRAINLSAKLGGSKFAMHSGFYIDILRNEIGKAVLSKKINSKEISEKQFVENYNILKKQADIEGVKLYIENNVLSEENYKAFNEENPLMLCCFEDYIELKKQIDFNLLLDVAHLKVSCNSFNLNFESEFDKFINLTDYIHISSNDGKTDSNQPIYKDNELIKLLSKYNLKDKTITLEIYDSIENIKLSVALFKEL